MLAKPANHPVAGPVDVCDKGIAEEDFEATLAGMAISVVHPTRQDEADPGVFSNRLRQRVEAVIWTLESQLGLEEHGGRLLFGLWARVVQRLLALNVVL